MQITNNAALPEPLVQAVSRPYTRQPNRISVTELIQPPQIRALSIRHDADLTEDASSRIWALLGQLLAKQLEQHALSLPKVIGEEKLTIKVNGWTVVGKYDLSEMLLDGERLTDYKLTSIWHVKEGVGIDWEQQLNSYREMLRRINRNVTEMEVVAIGRDWSQSKARYDKTYPQEQVKKLPVSIWADGIASSFIEERVRLHQEAEEKGIWPECTPEERWARPDQWAIYKKGQTKRAVKLYRSKHAAEFALAKDQYIVERPGESVRCELYCLASKFCEQFKREKEARSLLKQLENSVELLQNQAKEKTK